MPSEHSRKRPTRQPRAICMAIRFLEEDAGFVGRRIGWVPMVTEKDKRERRNRWVRKGRKKHRLL